MKTKKLFVQNISALLVGLKPPSNASQPASVDKIWKMFTDTIDVNCTHIDRKRNSRRLGS